MIVQDVADSFMYEILLGGIHGPGDVYRMALYSVDATLSRLTTAYLTKGEVIGAPGYEAGGIPLQNRVVKQEGPSSMLGWTAPIWPKATITARGGLIYNFSKQNRAVAVVDFGPSPTGDERGWSSTNGNFFVASDLTSLIRIGGVDNAN